MRAISPTNTPAPTNTPISPYIPGIQPGDAIPLDFLQNIEPPLKVQENWFLVDRTKNAAVVPKTIDSPVDCETSRSRHKALDGVFNTVRMIPGTNKIGAIAFLQGWLICNPTSAWAIVSGEENSIGE